jgi:hypothetical protein
MSRRGGEGEWLVSAVEAIEPEDRASVLEEFGAGLAALSEAQQKRLVNAAVTIPYHDALAEALAGLGPGLRALAPGLYQHLVSVAESITDPELRVQVLADLAR